MNTSCGDTKTQAVVWAARNIGAAVRNKTDRGTRYKRSHHLRTNSVWVPRVLSWDKLRHSTRLQSRSEHRRKVSMTALIFLGKVVKNSCVSHTRDLMVSMTSQSTRIRQYLLFCWLNRRKNYRWISTLPHHTLISIHQECKIERKNRVGKSNRTISHSANCQSL